MADKTDQRRRILEKAADNFFTLGYSRVTMDELAGELGMSKKTLYAHFAGKEDLLREIVDNFIQSVIAEQERILNNAGLDFEVRLSALLKLMVGVVSRMGPPLMRDIQRAAPDVWEHVEQIRQQRISKVFGLLLDEGQRCGYVRKDLDLPFVVMVMATTIRDILNPEVLAGFPISSADAFETLRAILMGGIFTDLGRKKFIPGQSSVKFETSTS